MVASPEIIEQVIDTYRRAAQANRDTPGRQGNVVHLAAESADELVIAGDLHGNRLNLNKLLQIADLSERPRRHLVLQEVCHGGPPYPSGAGCLSHTMLEDVARCKAEHPQRFHFLLSNHELAELTEFPIVKAGKMLNLLFRCGLKEMYGCDAERVHAASLEFIRTCPLAVQTSDGVFVSHSAPAGVDRNGFDADVLRRPLTDGDLAQHGAAFQLVWGRDHRAENAEAFAAAVGAELLIHGHEPCVGGCLTPNARQIILDSCTRKGCFLIVPIGQPLTHEQLARRIEYLHQQ